MIKDRSHLKFSALQTGNEFTGEFGAFDAEIMFHPEQLDQASVRVTVDMGSFDAFDKDRNEALPSKEWFHLKEFPKAVFLADDFTQNSDGSYVTNGSLKLKDISRELALPFTLEITDGEAVMKSTLTLNRADWNVGTGIWATDDWVSLGVSLDIEITATSTE